jgi:hypothetical protein
MSPIVVLFALRALLAALLYGFLGLLLWLLGQDVRLAAKASQARTRRLGRVVVLESALPALAPGTHFPLAGTRRHQHGRHPRRGRFAGTRAAARTRRPMVARRPRFTEWHPPERGARDGAGPGSARRRHRPWPNQTKN